MKQLVIEDEKESIALALLDFCEKYRKEKPFKRVKNILFAGDDSFLCDYLMTAVNSNHRDGKTAGYFRSVRYLSAEEIKESKDNGNLVFFFVDTTNLQNKDAVTVSLREIRNLLCGTKHSRCVLTVLLPKIEDFPGEVTSLSERELDFFMEKVCDKSAESEYYFEIEKMCRSFVRDDGADITLLRFDNVFAPDCFHTPSFDLPQIVSEAQKSGTIVITDEDEEAVTTATYVRNACCAVFAAAFSARKGHIYNVAYNTVSVADIKRSVFNGYKERFSLSVTLTGKTKRRYNALNQLVFQKLKIKRCNSFQSAVNYTVAYLTDYDCPDILEKMNLEEERESAAE